MATRIRLTRTGKRHHPSYRVVVMDSRSPRDGKAIENLGYYNPSLPEAEFELDKGKYQAWLAKGALPTDAVKSLIDGTYVYKPYKPGQTEEVEQSADEPKNAEDTVEITSEELAETQIETTEPEAKPLEDAVVADVAEVEANKEEKTDAGTA